MLPHDNPHRLCRVRSSGSRRPARKPRWKRGHREAAFTVFGLLVDMGFMPFSRTWMDRSHRAKRLAVVALGVGVFALAARTLQPSRSTAAPEVQQSLRTGARPGAIVPV